MTGLGESWWEDFGTTYSDPSVTNPDVNPLTWLCIQTVALKALGAEQHALAGFAELSSGAAAEMFPWAFEDTTDDDFDGIQAHFSEFNDQWPIDEVEADEDQEYASAFLIEFADEIPAIVRNFASIQWSKTDFRYLSNLSGLSGEDEIKAILFSILRDPRMPEELVGDWIVDGDGALDLQYGLALNPVIDSPESWKLLEKAADDYFAIAGNRDDLDWLLAARPQTKATRAKALCERLSDGEAWAGLFD